MSADFVEKNINCVPRTGAKFSTTAKISPEEGFLLSQADGRLSLKEILLVLPFDKAKVGEMLIRLWHAQMITWEGGSPPPPLPQKTTPAEPTTTAAAKPTPKKDADQDWDDDFFDQEPTPAKADDAGLASKTNPTTATATPTPIDSDLADELDSLVKATSQAPPSPASHNDGLMMELETELDAAIEQAPAFAGHNQEQSLAANNPSHQEQTTPLGSADFSDLALDDSQNQKQPVHELSLEAIDPELLQELEALDSDVDSIISSLADGADHGPVAFASNVAKDQKEPLEISADDLDQAAAELDELASDLNTGATAAHHTATVDKAADPHQKDVFGLDDLDDELAEIGAALDDVFEEAISPDLMATDQASEISVDDIKTPSLAVQANHSSNALQAPLDNLDQNELTAAKPLADSTPTRPPKASAASSKGRTILNNDEKIEDLKKRIRIQQRILEKDDPFEALGVKGGSSDKEIRDAWHRLSRVFHPDRYYNIELPAELAAELNDVYNALQAAYEKIGTREARRAFMFARRNQRIKKPGGFNNGDPNDTTTKPEKQGDAADGERLGQLAEEALAKGQYKSAATNFKLAATLTGNKEFEKRSKLVSLLETFESRLESLLDSDEPPLEVDVQRIEDTLVKIKDILPKNALLLRKITQFLYESGTDAKLTRELFERLLKLNRLPETLILGAKVLLKLNQPQAALDLLDEAKQRDTNNAEIKSMIKDIKRSLK